MKFFLFFLDVFQKVIFNKVLAHSVGVRADVIYQSAVTAVIAIGSFFPGFTVDDGA